MIWVFAADGLTLIQVMRYAIRGSSGSGAMSASFTWAHRKPLQVANLFAVFSLARDLLKHV